jgi:hypothetical protein
MTVKEKLDGLFVEIASIKDLAIFDCFTPTILDKYYIGMFGSRTLSAIATTNSVHDLAEIIVEFYGTKWDSILAQYTASITELKEYSEIISETINDNGGNTFTRENTNKVSAFNDDNFVDDKNEIENQTTETENKKVREQTLKKVRDTKEYTDLILYLRNNYLCDTIFIDINDISTLSIFE